MTARSRASAVRVIPVVRGCADYVTPFAVNAAEQYIGVYATGSTVNVPESLKDLKNIELNGAWKDYSETSSGSDAERVALIRLAAVTLVILAFDEIDRGAKACESIDRRLDIDGNLKPKRVAKAKKGGARGRRT